MLIQNIRIVNAYELAAVLIISQLSQRARENQAESGGLIMLKSISIWVSHGKTPISCIFCTMKYKLL